MPHSCRTPFAYHPRPAYADVEDLRSAPGVVALLLAAPGEPLIFRGDSRWAAVLQSALLLLDQTGLAVVRVSAGCHEVVARVRGEDGEDGALAVVVEVGAAAPAARDGVSA